MNNEVSKHSFMFLLVLVTRGVALSLAVGIKSKGPRELYLAYTGPQLVTTFSAEGYAHLQAKLTSVVVYFCYTFYFSPKI